MASLTEFLEARIAEDEAVAKAATEGPWASGVESSGDAVWHTVTAPEFGLDDWMADFGQRWQDAKHAARFDPVRVLAECAAKRSIIAAQKKQEDDDDPSAWIVASEVLLASLASVYSNHRDYRQEWAA